MVGPAGRSAIDDHLTAVPLDVTERVRLLRNSKLLTGMSHDVVAAMADEMEFMALPGGTVLYSPGEPSDALYYVFRGCVGVFERDATGQFQMLNEVAAGETVGELSVIADRPRAATVAALRDTELWRLSREAFERLAVRHPDALTHLLRFIVARLDRIIRHETTPHPPRTFALLPVSGGVASSRFAVALAAALGRLGGEAQLLTPDSSAQTTEWFHRVESQAANVLYLADPSLTPWTRLCLRQADRILFLGSIDSDPPQAWPVETDGDKPFAPRRDLVLLRDTEILPPGRTSAWLKNLPRINHHHVRLAHGTDFDRLARLMTDRAVGAVFAGGGARGFAHIGVVRALQEAGVPIDRVGGTSMGALIGAGVAGGLDWQDLRDLFRRSFVDTNPLSDYTVPFVSLFAGRKVTRLLRTAYGEFDIEDLQRPFFCVAANLSAGRVEVIRRGRLWQGLRASVSLPGILPPVVKSGQVLVDGGVMDNLPVEIMREYGEGPIIGVDIETAGAISAGAGVETPWSAWEFVRRFVWHRRQTLPLPSIVKILLRSALVSSDAASARHRTAADLVFQPPTAHIDLLDWQALDRVIDIGYRHATQMLEQAARDPAHPVLFLAPQPSVSA